MAGCSFRKTFPELITSMRHISTPLKLLVLTVLLALQAALIGATLSNREVMHVPLEVGAEFPYSVATWGGEELSPQYWSSAQCEVGFIMSTSCAACTALAKRSAEKPKNGLQPLWFVGGEPSDVASWLSEVGLDRDRVVYLTPQKRWPWSRALVGDIWFTPTRVVLDSDLELRDARPSDEVPSEGELQRLCVEGGIAPKNLQELERLVSRPTPSP